MSPRSFARHFTESFGTTPAQYVARIRLEAARAALEQTRQPLGQIARRCGFGSAATLRRRFHQSFRVAPAENGRAAGRTRVWQYGQIPVVAGSLKKTSIVDTQRAIANTN